MKHFMTFFALSVQKAQGSQRALRESKGDVRGRRRSGLGGSFISCIQVIWKFFLLSSGTNPHPYNTALLTAPGRCCAVWKRHKSPG